MQIKEMNWLKGLEGSDNDEFYKKLGTMRFNEEKPALSKLDFLE